MNREDLSRKLAGELNISFRKSEKYLNYIIEAIIKGTTKDGKTTIRNFGLFTIRKYKHRNFKSFMSGKKVKIPAFNVPAFRASKALKKLVNQDSKRSKGRKAGRRD